LSERKNEYTRDPSLHRREKREEGASKGRVSIPRKTSKEKGKKEDIPYSLPRTSKKKRGNRAIPENAHLN